MKGGEWFLARMLKGGHRMDRKIVVRLLAKRLEKILTDFTGERALHLGVESKEFEKYLLELIPEAITLIKEEMANKQSR